MAKKKISKSAAKKKISKPAVNKKPAPKKKISKKEAAIKRSNSGKLAAVNRKLGQKGLSIPEKRKLEKEVKKYKKVLGKKELSPVEIERYKKEKKSLSSQMSKLTKKFKSSKSETEKNKIFKKIMSLGARVNEVNKIEGRKVKVIKKIESGIELSEDNNIVNTVPVWVVRTDFLLPSIKNKNIKTISFEASQIGMWSRSFTKKKGDSFEIRDYWQDVFIEAVRYGSKIACSVEENLSTKSISFTIRLL